MNFVSFRIDKNQVWSIEEWRNSLKYSFRLILYEKIG